MTAWERYVPLAYSNFLVFCLIFTNNTCYNKLQQVTTSFNSHERAFSRFSQTTHVSFRELHTAQIFLRVAFYCAIYLKVQPSNQHQRKDCKTLKLWNQKSLFSLRIQILRLFCASELLWKYPASTAEFNHFAVGFFSSKEKCETFISIHFNFAIKQPSHRERFSKSFHQSLLHSTLNNFTSRSNILLRLYFWPSERASESLCCAQKMFVALHTQRRKTKM